jgi:DNA-binding transcriptional MerR regulator
MADKSNHSAEVAAALRIGDLARLSGIGKATIEHYLRLGLLQPRAVSGQGYRLFDEDAVTRLAVVRTGRRAGFALPELRAALDVVEPSTLIRLLTASSPAQCRAELVTRGAAIEG